jgi:hypothetical protein
MDAENHETTFTYVDNGNQSDIAATNTTWLNYEFTYNALNQLEIYETISRKKENI